MEGVICGLCMVGHWKSVLLSPVWHSRPCFTKIRRTTNYVLSSQYGRSYPNKFKTENNMAPIHRDCPPGRLLQVPGPMLHPSPAPSGQARPMMSPDVNLNVTAPDRDSDCGLRLRVARWDCAEAASLCVFKLAGSGSHARRKTSESLSPRFLFAPTPCHNCNDSL